MKFALRFLLLGLSFTIIPHISLAEDLPEYRPALIGQHPRSLVNKINTQSLMKRGQRDGIIMFSAYVSSLGQGGYMQVYRCSPNSELLQKEAMDQCWYARFEPAIYHHQKTPVVIVGTIVYFIKDDKPHLRIFLNQEDQDLKAGKDFVAPQFAIVSGNPKYEGIYYPPNAPGNEAVVAASMDCDNMGKPSNLKVEYEYPTGKGWGAEVVKGLRDAVFIPGFRNGKPVPCRFTTTIISFGAKRGSHGVIKSG